MQVSKGILLAALSAVFIVALTSGVGLTLSLSHPSTVTITQTVITSQTVVTYYYSPSVAIPVTCCPTLPLNFVVGSLNGNLYGFNVTTGSPPTFIGNGSTRTYIPGIPTLAFEVYQPVPVAYNPNPPPLKIQWANFTWGGTFSETVPTPSNMTLFDGAVRMDWFVNSSMLYVYVSTK